MKNRILQFAAVMLLAACSAPKYSYNFDYYDYNSGRKKSNDVVTVAQPTEVSPLILTDQQLVASADATPVIAQPKNLTEVKKQLAQKMSTMTKDEKKEFKKRLTADLKNVVKSKKKSDSINAPNAKQAWDYDLKMAAIFGAIGLVLTALGGVNTVFWVLGAVALIVGVIFLIKWLARQ